MQRTGNVTIFTLGVIALLIAAVVVYDGRQRAAVGQLGRFPPQVEEGQEPEDPSSAQAILSRVRQHIALPEDLRATVAVIVDVDILREKNPTFYAPAQNGDVLIVTQTRAILFSPSKDVILDVAPIQLERSDAP